MSMQQNIENKIKASLAPKHLEVVNESHMHNVPPGSESHFKVIIVSDAFVGQSLVKRHQSMNTVLAQELKNDIHALSLHTLTADEWDRKHGQTEDSPRLGDPDRRGQRATPGVAPGQHRAGQQRLRLRLPTAPLSNLE